jgi:Fur family ferric uptake transcriptional regulator
MFPFMITAEELLHTRDLKGTACRKFIISRLLESEHALSESELKGDFPDLFDRVTFYRTLKTLEEYGIIHKIVLNDNSVKYALNNHHHTNSNLHSHFHCEVCDEVLCLGEKIRFEAELPAHFIKHEVFVVVEGICANCTLHAN